MLKDEKYFKGRGAQLNVENKFLRSSYVQEHVEGIDVSLLSNDKTEYISEYPKKLINKVESPDVGLGYSMNPYQGCEHGCVYCYARNSHQYWGYSAGLDFERKIIVKENAVEALESQFKLKNHEVHPIMLSGNTDCYQPIERKKKLTRGILEMCAKYNHPVCIITKNSLVLRDLDILTQLNAKNLINVSISITSLNEDLRRRLEPRTVSSHQRLNTVEKLAKNNIPVHVMMAPIIPGLNSHEIPSIIEKVASAGALAVGYTTVRLNGVIDTIFSDWLEQNYPDKKEKVLNLIKALHGGKLNDTEYGRRMKGDGPEAIAIQQLFRIAKKKHLSDKKINPLNRTSFVRTDRGQLNLFND